MYLNDNSLLVLNIFAVTGLVILIPKTTFHPSFTQNYLCLYTIICIKLFIYSHSLKLIKFLHNVNNSSISTPNPQYNGLKQNEIDYYDPLAKLRLIFLLTNKAYMLQMGFTHSTWTKFTFPFLIFFLNNSEIGSDFILSGIKFHNAELRIFQCF